MPTSMHIPLFGQVPCSLWQQTSLQHANNRTVACGASIGRHPLGRVALRTRRGSVQCCAADDDGNVDANTDEPPSIGDWRAFKSRLVAVTAAQPSADESLQTPENMRLLRQQNQYLYEEGIWASPSADLASGSLLLARPEAPFMSGDERVAQLVVLLLRHDAMGSEGIMLNRPSFATVGDLLAAGWGSDEGLSELGPVSAFADSTVYLGGMFSPSRITRQKVVFIHGMADLPGCTEVCAGVYAGGEGAAARRVLEGGADPLQYRFFSGSINWQPGQLEAEVGASIWTPAACSRSVILKPCWQLPAGCNVECQSYKPDALDHPALAPTEYHQGGADSCAGWSAAAHTAALVRSRLAILRDGESS